MLEIRLEEAEIQHYANIEFSSDALRSFLQRRKVATMPELKGELGTTVDMTVLRKLQPLGYVSSYSQRGKFYTLREVAEFDARGLFQLGEARFSRFGPSSIRPSIS